VRAEFLPYCRPFIEQDDIDAVTDTLSRGWLTSGPNVREFEKRFSEAAGVTHAVALNSCTAALHLGMIALGVGEGDEVVLPSLSFVAGANCVVQLGATPVFCDVDPATLCLSVETIERVATPRTKAIMTMHYAGRPASVAPIVAWAKQKGIKVFEDAALAIGMLDDGEWPGTRSDAAAYSFYATKNVTSAEGGMFLTNDDTLMERVRGLSLHGMDRDAWKRYTSAGSWRYDVLEHGYKDNLSDLAAALGISQLKKLDAMQRRRDEIARTYTAALQSIPGVTVGGVGTLQPKDRHGWCTFPILVDERAAGIGRDQLIDELKTLNIGTSVHYIPSHLFTAYQTYATQLPVTEAIWQRLISLPLYPGMTDADVHDVINALRTSVPGTVSQAV
jgi:dTDP-4-amino-4,6-dideoxygalactose transaminase